MDFEDRITIPTPEGVELELTLAGLGSRALAGLIDLILKGLLILALFVALLTIIDGDLAYAILIPSTALTWIGYDMAFELRGGGRTPGKRRAGLRVVRSSGRPVDLTASAIRNFLRLIDGLALMYAPTVISILVTRRNQRIGDLAADTVVIRERRAAGAAPEVSVRDVPFALPARAAAWDVSAVGADDLSTVRSFLERREQLTSAARERVAAQLADALRPRVGGSDEPDPERFLENLYATKRARGG